MDSEHNPEVESSLWEPEVFKVHEFFTELLSMEGK